MKAVKLNPIHKIRYKHWKGPDARQTIDPEYSSFTNFNIVIYLIFYYFFKFTHFVVPVTRERGRLKLVKIREF